MHLFLGHFRHDRLQHLRWEYAACVTGSYVSQVASVRASKVNNVWSPRSNLYRIDHFKPGYGENKTNPAGVCEVGFGGAEQEALGCSSGKARLGHNQYLKLSKIDQLLRYFVLD